MAYNPVRIDGADTGELIKVPCFDFDVTQFVNAELPGSQQGPINANVLRKFVTNLIAYLNNDLPQFLQQGFVLEEKNPWFQVVWPDGIPPAEPVPPTPTEGSPGEEDQLVYYDQSQQTYVTYTELPVVVADGGITAVTGDPPWINIVIAAPNLTIAHGTSGAFTYTIIPGLLGWRIHSLYLDARNHILPTAGFRQTVDAIAAGNKIISAYDPLTGTATVSQLAYSPAPVIMGGNPALKCYQINVDEYGNVTGALFN